MAVEVLGEQIILLVVTLVVVLAAAVLAGIKETVFLKEME